MLHDSYIHTRAMLHDSYDHTRAMLHDSYDHMWTCYTPRLLHSYNHKWTEQLFAPLIREGYFASVVGGVEESKALLKDSRVDHVHMTGRVAS